MLSGHERRLLRWAKERNSLTQGQDRQRRCDLGRAGWWRPETCQRLLDIARRSCDVLANPESRVASRDNLYDELSTMGPQVIERAREEAKPESSVSARPSSDPEDAIVPLVCKIAGATFDSLPSEAIAAAKKSVLDCIATTIGGSSAPGVKETLSQLKYWGGRPESTVVLFGDRLPAHDAALVNVIMSHALELDDSHYPAIVHPTTPTLWAGLATAEALSGVSGRDLIAAIAVGVDFMARLGLAAPRTIDLGYHTALFSGFGAAAVTAKLRGLDHKTMRNALGIAFSQASATVQAGSDGALVKRLQPAFNTSDGMKAVLLAQRGITGVSKILEGQFGLFRLFNHSDCDRTVLLDDLDSRYLGTELSTKLYPTSRCAHSPIEGTLALVRENDLKPDQIAEVVVEVQESCFKREREPYDPVEGTSQVTAQFSIDYNVAAAILWRDVFIRQIQDECTLDPRVLELTRKVRVRRNTADVGTTPYTPTRITIVRTDGSRYSTVVRSLRGSPESPLSWEEIISERLNRCMEFSAVPLPSASMDSLVSMIGKLEEVPDVREITRLMVPA